MHLRRALLLFAIVLGLAALASAVSRPPRESARERQAPPPAGPSTPEAAPREAPGRRSDLTLPRRGGGRTAALGSGQAATLLVSVPEPGQVELAGLGLTAAGDPNTPARFELLAGEPGTHRVRFTPAGGGEARTIGRVVVR